MSNSTSLIECDADGFEAVSTKTIVSPNDVPDTYFHTLWEGLDQWYAHLAAKAMAKGWGLPTIKLADLAVDPMYAGTSQRFLIPLSISERDDWDSADMVWEVIDGGRFKKNKPPSRKKLGHSMMISVYKRDEGVRVYEFTAYIS